MFFFFAKSETVLENIQKNQRYYELHGVIVQRDDLKDIKGKGRQTTQKNSRFAKLEFSKSRPFSSNDTKKVEICKSRVFQISTFFIGLARGVRASKTRVFSRIVESVFLRLKTTRFYKNTNVFPQNWKHNFFMSRLTKQKSRDLKNSRFANLDFFCVVWQKLLVEIYKSRVLQNSTFLCRWTLRITGT